MSAANATIKVRVRHGRHNGRDEKGNPKVFEKGAVLYTTRSRYLAFRDKFDLLDSGGEKLPGSNGKKGTDDFDVKKAKKEELVAKAEELGLEFDKDAKVDELRDLVAEELADLEAGE